MNVLLVRNNKVSTIDLDDYQYLLDEAKAISPGEFYGVVIVTEPDPSDIRVTLLTTKLMKLDAGFRVHIVGEATS